MLNSHLWLQFAPHTQLSADSGTVSRRGKKGNFTSNLKGGVPEGAVGQEFGGNQTELQLTLTFVESEDLFHQPYPRPLRKMLPYFILLWPHLSPNDLYSRLCVLKQLECPYWLF